MIVDYYRMTGYPIAIYFDIKENYCSAIVYSDNGWEYYDNFGRSKNWFEQDDKYIDVTSPKLNWNQDAKEIIAALFGK